MLELLFVGLKLLKRQVSQIAGNYTLQGIELCLLAIKGSMKTQDRTVRQVLMHPRLYHSKKPDVIREEIVRLFGDVPRLEMFARHNFSGWDAWGNEVEDSIDLSQYCI